MKKSLLKRKTALKRKTPLNKKGKNTEEKTRKKCVEIAKKLVRIIQDFTCQYCGKKEPNVKTHGSHIYSEGIYKSMSADLDNILCLCYTHHLGGYMQVKEPSWHKNPIEMVNWFEEKYPERTFELKTRATKPFKVNWDLRLIALKEMMKKYEG